MSFSAMTWARTVSFGSPIRKAIAYTLADHHNGGSGRCDPSVETIARESDASIRATEINLRRMERAGAISVLRRPGRPNCYVLNFAWGTATSPIRAANRKRHTPAPDAGVPSAPTPAYECVETAPTPAPDAPEPEREDSTVRKEERESASASPPAPAQSPPVDEILVEGEGKEASRIEQEAPPPAGPRIVTAAPSRRTPLTDDWQPDRETRQAAIDAGIDPDDIREELGDWWLRNPDKPQGDWNAMFRAFVRQAKRGRHPSGGKPSGDRWDRPWLTAALGFEGARL